MYALAELPIRSLRVRYDCEAVSALGASDSVTSARLAWSPSFDAASVKRKSICVAVGCRASICSGATQPCALRLRSKANPTTVRSGPDGTSSFLPRSSAVQSGCRFRTTSPGRVAQRPAHTSSRSTGAAGSARPTMVRSLPRPKSMVPRGSSITAWAKGPAAASTPGCRAARASSASKTAAGSKAATTCGPRCFSKALSKGAVAASSRPSATTIAVVEVSVTSAMTRVWSLRRRTAARAVRHTALMRTAPGCARPSPCRRRTRPAGWHSVWRGARRGSPGSGSGRSG